MENITMIKCEDGFTLPESLVTKIVDIALDAGRAIMEIYAHPDYNVIAKADQSPLTAADLASDRVITAGLKSLAIEYPILSEESAQIDYADRKNWERYWLVDPLDGTREFIKRNGEFTVNIALIENGLPVLGVVYAPALAVLYFAAKEAGAFVRRSGENARRIQVVAPAPGECLKVVASRSHSDIRTTALLDQLGAHQCISMGSSLKLCLVAEGAAHFYPRLGPTMEWDTAAANAVVLFAGGMVCNINGEALRYNKPDLHNPEFFVFPANDATVMAFILQGKAPN
jgi:3'(2'), 5'-bisphosphate nucleotidase